MRRSIQSFYIPLGTTHGHLAVVGTPWMEDWSLSSVGWGIGASPRWGGEFEPTEYTRSLKVKSSLTYANESE